MLTMTTSFFPLLLAQQSTELTDADIAAVRTLTISFLVILVASYGFVSFFMQRIFSKCGVENAWLAWIPVFNTYALFKASDEDNPVLWTVLGFVPLANIAAAIMQIIAWTRICKKLGQSPWILLFAVIPLAVFVLLGYLAYL